MWIKTALQTFVKSVVWLIPPIVKETQFLGFHAMAAFYGGTLLVLDLKKIKVQINFTGFA